MAFLMLETIAEKAWDLLKNEEVFQVFKDSNYPPELIKGIITRGKGRVHQDLIDGLPNLQVITRCGVGLDNIDVNYASSKGIAVINAPGANSDTVAEHTLAMMLAVSRDIFNSINEVNQDNWLHRNHYNGDEIRGKTLGILGLGNIGKKVAILAQSFGMHVIYWDKYISSSEFTSLSIEQVLAISDFVSLHIPLTEETKFFIDSGRLKQFKKGAILINNARGALIEQDAVLKALNSGDLKAYIADGMEREPPREQDKVFLSHPNTFITPHVSSLTKTTYDEMCYNTVSCALQYLEGSGYPEEMIFNRKELE